MNYEHFTFPISSEMAELLEGPSILDRAMTYQFGTDEQVAALEALDRERFRQSIAKYGQRYFRRGRPRYSEEALRAHLKECPRVWENWDNEWGTTEIGCACGVAYQKGWYESVEPEDE